MVLYCHSHARATDVVMALDRAVVEFGCPRTIRLDNGSQFTAEELDLWAYAHEVTLDFSRPGKPTDNAFSEAFNSRFRLECLNQHWFLDIEDARAKIETWRQDYNTVRPHGAIGNKVPMDLVTLKRSRISSTQIGPDIGWQTRAGWDEIGSTLLAWIGSVR